METKVDNAKLFAEYLATLTDEQKTDILLGAICTTTAGKEKAKAAISVAKKADKNEDLKNRAAVATAILVAAHEEIKAALQPIFAARGLDLSDGKRIFIHDGGKSGEFLMDVSYPEMTPDVKPSNGTRGQNPRTRGVVILAIPEMEIYEKVAENATAAFSYLYNKGTSSYDTNKDAFEHDGMWHFEHKAAEKETTEFMGTVERNILTLTALGYNFFFGCTSKELAEKYIAGELSAEDQAS
jgi:hypothetical protein